MQAQMAPTAEPFKDTLKRLRTEKGVTTEALGLEVRNLATKRGIDTKRTGASFSSLTKHAAGNLDGSPSMVLMELVAEALGVQPTEFVEYRLANARAMLDEREVGLDAALEVLTRIESAIGSAPRARRASEAGRQARSQTPTPAVRSAPKKSPASGRRKSA